MQTEYTKSQKMMNHKISLNQKTILTTEVWSNTAYLLILVKEEII